MVSPIARTAREAWSALVEHGGIETQGRDESVEEELREALCPSARSLDEALNKSSTDDLVRAFFSVVSPFVPMFRAILDFFERAKTNQGRTQWRIQIKDEYLELAQFVEFIETWNSLDCEIEVPAIDSKGSWVTNVTAKDYPELARAWQLMHDESGDSTGVEDVDYWLTEYRAGRFFPFPDSLLDDSLPASLFDAAGVARTSLDVIAKKWPDRKRMLSDLARQSFHHDESDGYNSYTIAQHETDHRIASTVLQLALYRNMPSQAQLAFAKQLAAQFARYPRLKVGIRSTRPELERMLSMPLWQKRHELYAVWIATEIVGAVDQHDCELHCEEGKITFAFRETLVATIKGTPPTVRLYAERRSPISNPVGSGRRANVQPDYTMRRKSGEVETCGLVVEVKHYKNGAPGKFREVLLDYARAHQNAKVLLVSHGPASVNYLPEDSDACDRCVAIGGLTVSHRQALATFRKFVSDYVGERVDTKYVQVIAIDVSASMRSALASPELIALVEKLATDPAWKIALIDAGVRKICTLGQLSSELRGFSCGLSTSLEQPLAELTEDYGAVVVITDSEGLSGLDQMTVSPLESELVGGVVLQVVRVSSTPK